MGIFAGFMTISDSEGGGYLFCYYLGIFHIGNWDKELPFGTARIFVSVSLKQDTELHFAPSLPRWLWLEGLRCCPSARAGSSVGPCPRGEPRGIKAIINKCFNIENIYIFTKKKSSI